MQQSQNTVTDQHASFTGVLSQSAHIANRHFKPKRVSLIAVGAFLVGLVLVVLSSKVSGNDATLQVTAGQPAAVTSSLPAQSSSADTSAVASSGTDPPASRNQTSVTINGQNIPIPSSGNIAKTVTNGSDTTTVNVSNSSSSTTSSSTNSSSSHIDVQQVDSSSSSSGGSAD